VTFRNLIKSTSYKSVFNNLYKDHYKHLPDEEVIKYDFEYSQIYESLKQINFTGENKYKIYITEKEEITFDDESPIKFIDVCIYDSLDDEIYAMDMIPWSDIVDLEIQNTLNLKNEKLAASILWEITFWGFNERSILNNKKLLEDSLKEKMTPITFDDFVAEIKTLK